MDICRLYTHGALPDSPSIMSVCLYIQSMHLYIISTAIYILSMHLYILSMHLCILSMHFLFHPCTYIFFPQPYIFHPSTYILYIRCNSLPPRVRPVGVGVLPPHAKALNIGYKGLWLGSEDESCRFGTCLRSSGGQLPAFLTNSFCPICVIKRWLIIKRIAILLHKHRGSVHANVVFIRKNLPE